MGDCCKSAPNCCCGLFCAPCLASQSADRLGLAWATYLALALLCPCVAVLLLRSKARHRYGIEGGNCGDLAASCLCTACANCQIANEIDFH